jgi:RNA polymerase sigma-70 factor (ECF subfamily)
LSSTATARFSSLPFRNVKADSRCTIDSGLGDSATSDEELVASIATNDREALAHLFRRYVRLVYGTARKILRDAAEAEDLAQDVFLHIARKSYLYESSKGSARSWIVQITYFQALSRKGYLAARHYYGAVNVEESEAEELPAPLITDYDHSGEAVFGRRRWQRVQEILTEDQWETIRLHFFEGCTFTEIAKRRNQPQGNVRNHFYRGLARLRKYVFRSDLQGR